MKIADNYFDQGEYEKSKAVYQELFKKNSGSYVYLMGVVASMQELQEYEEATKYLLKFSNETQVYPNLLVEIGYNFQLQKKQTKAEEYYQMAIDKVIEVPGFAYSIGKAFQKYSLLDQAALSYQKGIEKQSNANYIIQLARIYGEQGKLEEMFGAYLDLIKQKPEYF